MSEPYTVRVEHLMRGPDNEIVKDYVEFDRREIMSIMRRYAIHTYPDYVDHLVMLQYAEFEESATLHSVMRLWGAFFVEHRNMSGFVIPSRGDGGCFYNSLAKFIEIYELDINRICNDACMWLTDGLGSSEAYNYYIAWYLSETIPISMKLRLIAAGYILQHKEQFEGGFVDCSLEEFVYTQVLEYGSEADQHVIVALSHALGMNIHVVSVELDKSYDRFFAAPEPKGTIVVIHKGKAHYDLFLSQRQMAFIVHDYYGKRSGDLEKIVEYFDNKNRDPDLVRFMKTFYMF